MRLPAKPAAAEIAQDEQHDEDVTTTLTMFSKLMESHLRLEYYDGRQVPVDEKFSPSTSIRSPSLLAVMLIGGLARPDA